MVLLVQTDEGARVEGVPAPLPLDAAERVDEPPRGADGRVLLVRHEDDGEQRVLAQEAAVLVADEGLGDGGPGGVQPALQARALDAHVDQRGEQRARVLGLPGDDLLAAHGDHAALVSGVEHVRGDHRDVVVDVGHVEVLDELLEAAAELRLLILHRAGVVDEQEDVHLVRWVLEPDVRDAGANQLGFVAAGSAREQQRDCGDRPDETMHEPSMRRAQE